MEGDEGEWTFGVLQQPSQYWLMLGLGVAGLLIYWLAWAAGSFWRDRSRT